MSSETFSDAFAGHDWDAVAARIAAKTAGDVERALGRRDRDLDDFAALLSPAADHYLEAMARESRARTLRRFGRTVQLYAPCYLSNECQNICTYCGFSQDVDLARTTLTGDEILAEAEVLRGHGYEHLLLVTGEHSKVGPEYFTRALRLLTPRFAQLSLEVQPLAEDEYRRLRDEGLHAVLVYQETYHAARYREHHRAGKKRDFHHRLQTPDRLGRAGVHKIGLGALIGLDDWRVEHFFTALHLRYLQRRYWRTRYSISFPRLRPCAGALQPRSVISDRELVQLITAWRCFDEDVELSLSTREPAMLRDHLVGLGITSMSAGSKTEPGGYARPEEALEQFAIDDDRAPAEVADAIRARGFTVVWKDWDPAFSGVR